jgi:nitrogen regulatory protein PII
MKQVIAIVKPYLAQRVIQGIRDEPIVELVVSEIKCYGRQKNYLDLYTENEYSRAFLPKVRIEIWVNDEHVNAVIDRLISIARTGRQGDGKIFVLGTAI